MLDYAILLLLIAFAAGILGLGTISGTAASIAKLLFLIFLALYIVSLVRSRRPPA